MFMTSSMVLSALYSLSRLIFANQPSHICKTLELLAVGQILLIDLTLQGYSKAFRFFQYLYIVYYHQQREML